MTKTVRDFEVQGKTVLVRSDLNVPLREDGSIADDFKIVKSLDTLKWLLIHEAKVAVVSHLGEPDGQVVEGLRLDGVAKRLGALLGMAVSKTEDCVGPDAERAVRQLLPGQLVLLENVRFHKGETDNDDEFARQLASLGDLYVNDAFASCHRAHASVSAIVRYLPHAAGLLLQKEVESLETILQNPRRPLVALVGGAKVKTKAAFIQHIAETADTVIVSGLIKKEMNEQGVHFSNEKKIIYPSGDLAAPDINQESADRFARVVSGAKTVVWNGPFGKFENEEYKKGSVELAEAIVASGAFSVAGGGDTIAFLEQERMMGKFSHVSTGGGAMLAFLSGRPMPGLEALEDKHGAAQRGSGRLEAMQSQS